MRRMHIAVIGAIGLVGVLVGVLVLPLPGAHAAAPSAPYNAMTVDAGSGSDIFDPGESYVFTGGELTIVDQGDSDDLRFQGIAAGHGMGLRVAQNDGSKRFTTGATYTINDAAGTSDIAFSLNNNYGIGGALVGTLKVEQAVYSGYTITAFAATYSVICDGFGSPITGELRYKSTVGYVAAMSTSDDFGTLDLNSSAHSTVTITSLGTSSDTFGKASIGKATALRSEDGGGFTITSDTCSGKTLGYGATCVIGVTTTPTASGLQRAVVRLPDQSAGGTRQAGLAVTAQFSFKGSFLAMGPFRVLDTRKGTGAPAHPLGAGSVIHLDPTDGVPDVAAVVLNLTVTGPTANSFLTVYPTGTPRPNTSNINFPKGWTGANTVTVKLGTNHEIDIYNSAGSAQVIADVTGFYEADETQDFGAGSYFPLDDEVRMFDTRSKSIGALGAHRAITTYIDFQADNPHLLAFAVNVTAVGATKPGFLTAWNGFGGPPNTSTLNFTPGTTVSNFTILPVTSCARVIAKCPAEPSLSVYNSSAGSVNVIVDLFGVYDDSTISGGLRFAPITPTRIADTRSRIGAPGPVGSGATAAITAPSNVIDGNTVALDMNMTAINPSASTWLIVWPAGVSGVTRPGVSNLNPHPGQTVANDVITGIGPTDQFNVFNNAGSTNVIFDVDGLFDYFPYIKSDIVGRVANSVAPGQTPGANRMAPGPAGVTTTRPVQP